MEKGYTLLELVISMAILCIVILMISGFLGFGLGFSRETRELVNSGSHYRSVMLFLERNLESKSGVEIVKGKLGGTAVYEDVTDKSCKVELYMIMASLEENKERFSIYMSAPNRDGRRVMRYEKGSESVSGKMECGSGIDNLYLEPLPEGCSFREASGLRFTFENISRTGGVEFEKTIYFKNQKRFKLQ